MDVSVDTVTTGRSWMSSSVFGAALLIFGKKWTRPLFVKSYGRFRVLPLSIQLLILSDRNQSAFSRDPATCSMVSSSIYVASTVPACGRELSITCAYIRKRTGEIWDRCGHPEE